MPAASSRHPTSRFSSWLTPGAIKGHVKAKLVSIVTASSTDNSRKYLRFSPCIGTIISIIGLVVISSRISLISWSWFWSWLDANGLSLAAGDAAPLVRNLGSWFLQQREICGAVVFQHGKRVGHRRY